MIPDKDNTPASHGNRIKASEYPEPARRLKRTVLESRTLD